MNCPTWQNVEIGGDKCRAMKANAKPFTTCAECDKPAHVAAEKGVEVVEMKCDTCGKEFKKRGYLDRHIAQGCEKKKNPGRGARGAREKTAPSAPAGFTLGVKIILDPAELRDLIRAEVKNVLRGAVE
jgi:hypothetical protein